MQATTKISGLLLFLVVMAPRSHADDNVVTQAMVGHWESKAHIIVNWCKQKELSVSISIRSDDTVSGRVGDAELKNGKILHGRGWVLRVLNWGSEYIIKADLHNPIVASENISRKNISMPLDFDGASFTGGMHTSGSKFGGREKMKLSAMGLRLVPNPKQKE